MGQKNELFCCCLKGRWKWMQQTTSALLQWFDRWKSLHPAPVHSENTGFFGFRKRFLTNETQGESISVEIRLWREEKISCRLAIHCCVDNNQFSAQVVIKGRMAQAMAADAHVRGSILKTDTKLQQKSAERSEVKLTQSQGAVSTSSESLRSCKHLLLLWGDSLSHQMVVPPGDRKIYSRTAKKAHSYYLGQTITAWPLAKTCASKVNKQHHWHAWHDVITLKNLVRDKNTFSLLPCFHFNWLLLVFEWVLIKVRSLVGLLLSDKRAFVSFQLISLGLPIVCLPACGCHRTQQ